MLINLLRIAGTIFYLWVWHEIISKIVESKKEGEKWSFFASLFLLVIALLTFKVIGLV